MSKCRIAILGVAIALMFMAPSLYSAAPEEGTALVKGAGKLQGQRALGDKLMIWDDIDIWAGAGVGVEYNDNIQLQENGKKSDIIVSPNFFLSLQREYTELNTLNITSKLGYSYYLKNRQNNSRALSISPDSALVYEFQVRKIRVSISDAISLQEDPTSSPSLSGVARYRRYTNAFAISPSWDVNPFWTAGLTFSHNMLRTLGSDFKEQERDTFTAALNLSYKPTPGFSIGPFSSIAKTIYRKSVQNDSVSVTLGGNVFYKFSDYLDANTFVGVEKANFSNTGSVSDNTNAASFTFGGSINHRLSPHTGHSLKFEGGIRPGFQSNFFNDNKYTYSFNTQLNAFTKAVLTAFYQKITESKSDGEKANRIALLLNFNFAIMKNASLGTGYRFLVKDSKTPGKSYTENKVSFDFSYAF